MVGGSPGAPAPVARLVHGTHAHACAVAGPHRHGLRPRCSRRRLARTIFLKLSFSRLFKVGSAGPGRTGPDRNKDSSVQIMLSFIFSRVIIAFAPVEHQRAHCAHNACTLPV